MGFNVIVDVYSITSVRYDDVQRLKAYLYGHTTFADLPGYSIAEAVNNGDKQVVVILRTTVARSVSQYETRESHNTGVHIADELSKEAHRLANYQLDRNASGGMPGLLCGTLNEAYEVAADVLSSVEHGERSQR